MSLAALCLVACWVLPAGAEQGPVLTLAPTAASRALGPYLEILNDPGRALTIEEVSRPPWSGRFRPNPRPTLHLRPSTRLPWVRFTLAGTHARPGPGGGGQIWHLVLRGPTGPVRGALYAPADSGLDAARGISQRGGWLAQEIAWPGGGAGPEGLGRRTLLLPVSSGPRTFYLHLQVAHAQYLPLEVVPGRLLVPDTRLHSLMLGLMLGVLLGLMAYNLSVFFILRDAAYIYYLLTVAALGLINFSVIGGYSFEWLPQLPITAIPRCNYLLVIAANLAHTLFIMRFFRLKERGSRLYGPVLALLWLQVALVPVYAFLPLVPLALVTTILTIVRQALFFMVIIHSLVLGVAGARFYLVGYALLTASVWCFWLSYFGVLPYHPVIMSALPVGTVLEALFYTLALHQRLDALRRQQEEDKERYIELLVRLRDQEEQLQDYSLRLQQAAMNPPGNHEPDRDASPGGQSLAELEKSRDRLARMTRRLEEDLGRKSEALAEANAALKVLFERLGQERAGMEESVALTVRRLVSPALERLKQTRLSPGQLGHLQVLEAAVGELAGRSITTLAGAQANLTPAEAQVALLIRDGRASKEIAAVLGISEHTVAAHRKSIRAKLGLAGKPVNLAAHLRELA